MHNMEIEKLLQWALREELPKGHPVAASTWETTVERFAFLGTRVDVSCPGSPDGLGFVPGEPHPDAVEVGEAIRRLPRDFKLTRADCRDLLGHFYSLDRLAVRAIEGSAFNMAALVIRCAVLGSRMEYDIGHPTVGPLVQSGRKARAVAYHTDADGRILDQEANLNGHGTYPLGAATPIKWHEPSIGQVLEVRAEYAIWHRALGLLYSDLAGRLREIKVLPASARPEPWRTGQAPEPIVHEGAPLDDNRPLPLAPTGRPRMLRPLEPDIVTDRRRSRAKEGAEARKARARKNADLARAYSAI